MSRVIYAHMSAVIEAPEAATALPQEDVVETYLRERGKPMPGAEHAICQMRLGYQFMLAGTHIVFSELNLDLNGLRSIPDLCVYRRDQEAQVRNRIWVNEVPQIAVEIISPSQTLEEMGTRIDSLLNSGVPSVWLVIPFARVISVYQKGIPLFSITTGILTDPATGIAVNVDEVFA